MFLEKYSCSLVNSIEVSNFCLFSTVMFVKFCCLSKALDGIDRGRTHTFFSVTSCISCRHCIDLRTQMSVAPSSFCRSYNSFKDLFFVKRLDTQTHTHIYRNIHMQCKYIHTQTHKKYNNYFLLILSNE